MATGTFTPMTGTCANALVVDDDPEIIQVLAECLGQEDDLNIYTATSAIEATNMLSAHRVDVLVADLYLGEGSSGVDIIRRAKELNPETVSIMITGYPTLETAVSLLKLGGFDFFVKPFELNAVRGAVRRGLDRLRLTRENMRLREQVAISRLMQAVGSTVELDEILEMVIGTALRELSADAASILLKDETGNGLELRGLDGRVADQNDAEFLYGRDDLSRTVLLTGSPKILDRGQFDMFENSPGESPSCVYISQPLLAKGAVIGILNLVRQGQIADLTEGAFRSAGLVAGQAAVAIENARLYKNLHSAYLDTIASLANAIEIRDSYTRGHTDRVRLAAEAIATKLGWDSDRLFDLWMCCTLHDVGKIGVPDRILNKPGKLTDEEFRIMRTHPVIGAKIVEDVPFLGPALPYILYHHERWDGAGYPEGLKGEDIPIEGRILSVADTFDAIISDRPYRKGGPIERAVDELKLHAGTQFDPEIVEAFLELLSEHNLTWLPSNPE